MMMNTYELKKLWGVSHTLSTTQLWLHWLRARSWMVKQFKRTGDVTWRHRANKGSIWVPACTDLWLSLVHLYSKQCPKERRSIRMSVTAATDLYYIFIHYIITIIHNRTLREVTGNGREAVPARTKQLHTRFTRVIATGDQPRKRLI